MQADERGYPDVGNVDGRIVRMTVKQLLEGLRLVGMAVAESPEWKKKAPPPRRSAESPAHGQGQHQKPMPDGVGVTSEHTAGGSW